MVDQSLLRQAADRGVTICFADLDGADGLWVPEERTVLVSRGLSDAQAAEVIEHELAHVMIDDQHADLDAGKEVLAGHPRSRSWRRPETVALAAAVSLVAVVGGVMYGVNATRADDKPIQVAPSNGPGLTASESGDPRNSARDVITRRGPHGETFVVTVTPIPGTPTPTTSATASPTARATATTRPPAAPPRTTVPPSAPPNTSAPAVPSTDPPQTVPPTQEPTTPAPTTPIVESPGGAANTGDQGGAGGSDPPPGPTQPATVASGSLASIGVTSTDLSPVDGPVGSTLESSADGTTGR